MLHFFKPGKKMYNTYKKVNLILNYTNKNNNLLYLFNIVCYTQYN